MFEVGKLAVFSPELLDTDKVIDKLHATKCFYSVNNDFVLRLKGHLPTFISRIDTAVKGSDESYWHTLCNEPRSKLKALWKVKKESGKGPKSESQKKIEAEKHLMQAMYYCVYVIFFWRHEDSFRRYKEHAESLSEFQGVYEKDPSFPRDRMDKWETLFQFRNVMLLAAAVKPSMRNKGLFTKLGCILAEDRIHSMGGGQSFAADRRGYIYDKEGGLFAASPSSLCKTVDMLVKDFDLPPREPNAVKLQAELELLSQNTPKSSLSGKHKRCGPPTLSRTSSLSNHVSKSKRTGGEEDGLDVLLSHADEDFDAAFAGNLLRNMSLGDLSVYPSEEVGCAPELDLSAVPINLHSAYVVGRAFSYNAYLFNDVAAAPVLGEDEAASMSLEDLALCTDTSDFLSTSVSVGACVGEKIGLNENIVVDDLVF